MPEQRQSKLATTLEAAAYLRRSPTTLERWRRDGTGPRYMGGGGHGKTVHYRWSDLDRWLDAQVRATGEGGE